MSKPKEKENKLDFFKVISLFKEARKIIKGKENVSKELEKISKELEYIEKNYCPPVDPVLFEKYKKIHRERSNNKY